MRGKAWTDAENEILREEWAKGGGAAKRAAARLEGRPVSVCYNQASELRLTRPRRGGAEAPKPEGKKRAAAKAPSGPPADRVAWRTVLQTLKLLGYDDPVTARVDETLVVTVVCEDEPISLAILADGDVCRATLTLRIEDAVPSPAAK